MDKSQYLYGFNDTVLKNSNNKIGYLISYTGNIVNDVASIPNSKAIALTPHIAAAFIDPDYDSTFSSLKNKLILEPFVQYILTDISPLDSANISQFSEGFPLDLTGTGVVAAI